MKIAFHIPRMNWYRVLSSLIDAALNRGHQVECWHNRGAKLKENTPTIKKLPFFLNGRPEIVEYDKPEDIITLVNSRPIDIIIDLHPPRYPEIRSIKQRNRGKPLWILIDLPPSDCIMDIRNEEQLYGCDKFIVCNEYYLENSIRMITQDKEEVLEYVNENRELLGMSAVEWVKDSFMFQWTDQHVRYLRDNVLISGNSAFDVINHIKPEDVRKKWEIDRSTPIVSLLPCPFGYDPTASWEQMFMKDSIISRIKWMVKHGSFKCFPHLFNYPSNRDVVRSLKQFASKNGALLIAKKKHSLPVTPELARYCDRIVGDDNFYPHTALELFSVSNLVVGFYSFGAIEAAALNIHYLNVVVPNFPWKFYCDMRTPIHNCEPYDGVISSMTATELINKLPFMQLTDFLVDSRAREQYLKRFASWPLGAKNGLIMHALEAM